MPEYEFSLTNIFRIFTFFVRPYKKKYGLRKRIFWHTLRSVNNIKSQDLKNYSQVWKCENTVVKYENVKIASGYK